MPVLPVPLIIALLLTGFLVQRMMTRALHPTLLILIGCCAAQSAITAIVQYYGVSALRPVQPVFATVIPAVAWLSFRQVTTGRVHRWDVLAHTAGPIAALVCLFAEPDALDVLIPMLFAAYGFAILVVLAQGEDSLPHARLEHGGMSLLIWRVLAASLIASAATDVVIAFRLAAGDTRVLFWLPSLFSSFTLLVLGVLGLSHSIESQSDSAAERDAHSSVEEDARDEAIIDKLEAYVVQNAPYLDPDLTLARLARKVLVPEKQLSSAINKRTGENVSRYINNHRVRHACGLLETGSSVTDAMLASGFNTKSNFNREFLRVEKTSPRQWRQARLQT